MTQTVVLAVPLVPGALGFDTLRAIYRGAAYTLDESCRPGVEAGARVIDAIVAKGDPIYGVNRGFGKLASVRIDRLDLATLQ